MAHRLKIYQPNYLKVAHQFKYLGNAFYGDSHRHKKPGSSALRGSLLQPLLQFISTSALACVQRVSLPKGLWPIQQRIKQVIFFLNLLQ